MKTSDVLEETTNKIAEISLDFNDLTSQQIGALRAISDGRLDFDNASDRMMDVVYQLQDFNLVDELFDLTPTGRKAVDLAMKIGGFERRKAAKKAASKVDILDQDEDVYNTSYPTQDNDFEGDDWSIYQPNRFGTINDVLG